VQLEQFDGRLTQAKHILLQGLHKYVEVF